MIEVAGVSTRCERDLRSRMKRTIVIVETKDESEHDSSDVTKEPRWQESLQDRNDRNEFSNCAHQT